MSNSRSTGVILLGQLLSNGLMFLVEGSIERLSDVLRDIKKFTSKAILKAIVDVPESRREWLLDKFAFEAKRACRAENYKF